MPTALELSEDSRATAGVLLLAVLAVEYGGWHVLRIVRGGVRATEFQHTFARAGHAHAAVLVTLALVALPYADATTLPGVAGTLAHNGIPWAAVLIPAGFFLSSAGAGRTTPNRFVWLLYAGIVLLGAAVACLGYGLLTP